MINIIKKSFCTLKVPIEAIKKLRQQTGAPINQCKKALQQSNLNQQDALKWLQKKGLSNAQKILGKQTRQGVIGCAFSKDRKKVVMLEVNCQTDFVAKNELFVKFVCNLSFKIENESQQSKEKINKYLQASPPCSIFPMQNTNKNMLQQLKLLISRLQENIKIRRLITLHSDKGKFGCYVHGGYIEGIGSKSSVVEFTINESINQPEKQAEFIQFIDNIAAQALGCTYKYFKKQNIPREQIESQTEKVKLQLAKVLQKAPQHTKQKIIQGKLNASFYSKYLLTSMPYVLSNGNETVEEYWKRVEKQIDRKINIENIYKWQCK